MVLFLVLGAGGAVSTALLVKSGFDTWSDDAGHALSVMLFAILPLVLAAGAWTGLWLLLRDDRGAVAVGFFVGLMAFVAGFVPLFNGDVDGMAIWAVSAATWWLIGSTASRRWLAPAVTSTPQAASPALSVDLGPTPPEMHLQQPTPWAYLLGALVFVIAGAGMVTAGQAQGWWVVGFFGLCLIVFAINAVRRLPRLSATTRGLDITALRAVSHYDWMDITSPFSVRSSNHRKFVVFNRRKKGEQEATFSRLALGYDAQIPSTFGMTAEALALALNNWRWWRLGTTPPPPELEQRPQQPQAPIP